MVTVYKTTFALSEFDLNNLELLCAHTQQEKTWALHQALHFCQTSFVQAGNGRMTSVLHSNGTTPTISHTSVAEAFNKRSDKAAQYNVTLYRTTEALDAIQKIKTRIGAKSDDTAVAFALAFSAACVRRIQGANHGKKARIFFTATNNPNKSGIVLNKHPYDISFGNKLRRLKANLQSSIAVLNPWRKKDNITFTIEPRPAELPAPKTAAAENSNAVTTSDAKTAENKPGTELTAPVQALKQVKLKKSDGGFRL